MIGIFTWDEQILYSYIFRYVTMREPAVAGMFYPPGKRSLVKEIEKCLKKGPGNNSGLKAERIYGVISPHAGYTYSGPTASFGFLAMKESGMPDSVIIMGPNHRGLGGKAVVSDEDFLTPLGVMEVDQDLIRKLGLEVDNSSHAGEHSMEVQLPFIQYFDMSVKQVCISVSDQSLGFSEELGKRIASAVQASKGNVGLIASSDFTHCGWNYGYPVPSGMNAGQFAESRDRPVIEKLLHMDLENAFRKKDELGTTACGLGPIAAVMTASKELGADKARMMDYTTSYDTAPSDSAVGYASIVLYS